MASFVYATLGLLFPSKLILVFALLSFGSWFGAETGNYGDGESWQQRNPMELFYWSVLFGLAAIVSIYHGVKYDDGVTRGFEVTFILINLDTRFFELLALSFWFLGSRDEKIWSLSMIKNSLNHSK